MFETGLYICYMARLKKGFQENELKSEFCELRIKMPRKMYWDLTNIAAFNSRSLTSQINYMVRILIASSPENAKNFIGNNKKSNPK